MGTPATACDWHTAFFRMFRRTGSPIEMIAICAVIDQFGGDIANSDGPVDVTEDGISWVLTRGPGYPPLRSSLKLQYAVGRYKLDLAMEEALESGETARIAIECDGHNFHERTKEQAEHDRSRDRDLQAAGWVVMRFTGRELYRDPGKCAGEVWGMMHGLRIADWNRHRKGT
jgi:very-short-patch-repair endonuclease